MYVNVFIIEIITKESLSFSRQFYSYSAHKSLNILETSLIFETDKHAPQHVAPHAQIWFCALVDRHEPNI